VSTRKKFQQNKCRQKKYGNLLEKEAEAMPGDKMCINLIGPYTILCRKENKKKPLVCKCVTMIDPATGMVLKITLAHNVMKCIKMCININTTQGQSIKFEINVGESTWLYLFIDIK
jgi:hypothetical protein